MKNIQQKRFEAIDELLSPYYNGDQPFSISDDNSEGVGCMYNGPNGLHCAFAMAVIPEKRKLLIEGDSASKCIEDKTNDIILPKYRKLFTEREWDIIQSVHDDKFSSNSIYNLVEMEPLTYGLFQNK